MRHIPLPLSNGLMTRSGLEPRFLRVDLCSEVRLGLATCWGRLGRWFWVCSRNSVRLAESGSGGIQVEGLHVCVCEDITNSKLYDKLPI